MRICPQCKKDFGEQDFRICPIDGATLAETTSAPPADPMIGRVLDKRFRIIGAIGHGGMGAVYKAVHTQMDRVCAVKLLTPVATDWDSAVGRFRREAKLTSRIDSPNAVTIFDFGEAEPGLLYIAMEYIEGESLAELLTREHTLAIERVVRITNQIAGALASAHALGIVHRDLKPANIMIVRKGGEHETVKVLDFGIAKSIADGYDDHLTQTGYLLGTPTYMSPEQVLGESVDSRTDVYSLALIVYQMLCGQIPFEGDSLRALMMNRVHGEPKPLRDVAPAITEAVEQVVLRGLARELGARIADVQSFAGRLAAAAAGQDYLPEADPFVTLIERTGGNSAPPNSFDTKSQTPPLTVAGDTPSPPPSGSTFSPPLVKPKTEESATILAPQIPYAPETINAASWHGAAPPEAKRSSKMAPLIVGGALLVLVVVGVLGAGGVYLYLRANRTQPEATDATAQPGSQTSQPGTKTNAGTTSADGAQPADEYYRAGKSHQEQAASLTAAGSDRAAASKNEEAVVEYRKALASRSDFPQAHENLGVALYDLGRYAEAIAEYEIAISQYRQPSAQVFTNHGMALFAGKRHPEAADAFARALALRPDDAELNYYRGFALHHAGDSAGARAAFDSYLRAEPQGVYAKDVREIVAGRATPSLKLGGR